MAGRGAASSGVEPGRAPHGDSRLRIGAAPHEPRERSGKVTSQTPWTFANKVAVVTGASSGIGRSLAIALAERGCDLALVDIAAADLEETEAMVAARGRKVSRYVVDVSDRDAMRALPERVLAAHGQVDLVVNNAGISNGYHFGEQPIESFEHVIGVNLMGVVYGCRFFLPHLLQRPQAQLVNISSIFGFFGVPRQADYCTSKFGVRGLSESLWAELAYTSVRVLCVHPAGVRTNILRPGAGWEADFEQTQQSFDTMARTGPDQAAEKIVRAIERGKRRLRIGAEAVLIDWLARAFPTFSRWLARKPDPAA